MNGLMRMEIWVRYMDISGDHGHADGANIDQIGNLIDSIK